MKLKAVFAGILTGAVCISMMTACAKNENTDGGSREDSGVSTALSEVQGSDDVQSSTSEVQSSTPEESKDNKPSDGKTHTLTIRDSGKNEKLTAGFINTMSGASEDISMTKTDETADYYIYSCEGDTTKYNMVHIETASGSKTLDVAFNDLVSGWTLNEGVLDPYVVGREPVTDVKYETKTFKFDGSDKNVYIWTPEDYDPKSAEKYATVYAYDGQWVLTNKIVNDDNYPWSIGQHVESMMSETGYKAIVVAIETPEEKRNDELIPDLGQVAIQNYPTAKKGNALADFVCDTVVPYIQQNYNVYTDAEHTAIVGSSLGGLESLYTAFAHSDVFGTAGAMSPAFWAYDIKTWAEFLLPKRSEKNLPYIYFYAGDYKLDAGAYASIMNNALIQYNYPKDRLSCNIYQPGKHLSVYLHNIFPEFLQAMSQRKLSAIENGAAVPIPEEAQKQISDFQNGAGSTSREPTDKDYVYYDNSETKWEKVCAYWWGPYGASATMITSNEYYSKPWPGFEMERIGDTDIYRVIAPAGAVGIVFNNGVSDEDMAKGNETYQTEDIEYDQTVNPGQIYKIDTSKQAKNGRGANEFKYKYPAGSWTDYK